MDIAIKNTLNEIAMQIKVARRSVKDIAAECTYFAKQITDSEAQSIFSALASCRTRKQMSLVLGNFLG